MQPHGEEMIASRLAWLIQAWARAGSASASSSRKDGEQRRVLRFCMNLLEREDVKEKESGTEKVANPSIVDQVAFDQKKTGLELPACRCGKVDTLEIGYETECVRWNSEDLRLFLRWSAPTAQA